MSCAGEFSVKSNANKRCIYSWSSCSRAAATAQDCESTMASAFWSRTSSPVVSGGYSNSAGVMAGYGCTAWYNTSSSNEEDVGGPETEIVVRSKRPSVG